MHVTYKLYQSNGLIDGWTPTILHNPKQIYQFIIVHLSLSLMHCDVRQGVGVQVMRVVDYAHFALKKFESLSITL